MELSICMVSLNCREVVEDCLRSILASQLTFPFEIVIVDNGSQDGTIEYLRGRRDVTFVENGYNAGFTKATNRALTLSSGRYILWLNTDTILRADSLQRLYELMERTPKAGIVGPKVLNPDLSFQPQCKRGLPTPMACVSYLLGLDRFYPRHPVMAQYLLRNVSEDESSIVDSVSGCCLMARREVLASIGPLDEEIFGFGEDLDWCVRAANAGWEVWYYPESVIIHLKGRGGAHTKPYRKLFSMHHGMWIFYRKHLRSRYSWLTGALVRVGIAASLGVGLIKLTATRSWRRMREATSQRALDRSESVGGRSSIQAP